MQISSSKLVTFNRKKIQELVEAQMVQRGLKILSVPLLSVP